MAQDSAAGKVGSDAALPGGELTSEELEAKNPLGYTTEDAAADGPASDPEQHDRLQAASSDEAAEEGHS